MDHTESPAPTLNLPAIAADLGALAAKHAKEGDALRRLPPALADAFLRHDVYRMMLPQDLGGAAMDPLDYIDLVEEIAVIDGSTAWTLAIAIGSGLYVGYLPPERGRTLSADRDCGIAGAYTPFGQAERVEGGYRVSGRWGWASGVDQARWMVFGFTVASGEAGGPAEVRQGLAPREAFRVIDNWHVSGMRATGSKDYEVENLFIPADMTFRMFLGDPGHPAPVFRLPGAIFCAAVASVALGIARGAAGGLTEIAVTKRAFPGRPPLREQPFAQYAVAKAQALAESGSVYLRQAIEVIWRSVQRGEAVTPEQRARARRACVQAAEASAEAVDLCCRAAGGHVLFESQPFERRLRDVRAAIAQIVLQRSAMEDVGRVMFGLAPMASTF